MIFMNVLFLTQREMTFVPTCKLEEVLDAAFDDGFPGMRSQVDTPTSKL